VYTSRKDSVFYLLDILPRTIYSPFIATPRYMAQKGSFIFQWTGKEYKQDLARDES
jgi:hypothetical protein